MALKTVTLDKALTLTRDDGTQQFYNAGPQAMPEEDADHWYVKGHFAPTPQPKLGDLLYAEALERESARLRGIAEAAERDTAAAYEAYYAAVGTALPVEDTVEDVVEDSPALPTRTPARRTPTRK